MQKIIYSKLTSLYFKRNGFLLFTALYTVLGSLYFNELDLEPQQLVSVLATAALFQLDSMCEKCAEVMIETLDVEV